jgi:hypothetical protein
VKVIASQRCPFPVAFLIYGALAVVLPIVPALTALSVPFWSVLLFQLIGLLGFAVWLEKRRYSGADCPWLDGKPARRLVMYGALWLVGLIVFGPLSQASSDFLPVWAVLAGLALVSAFALVRIHVRVDHGEFEEAGASWPLVVASRLPVYLLGLIGVTIVVVGVLEFVHR